jgi:hypothetical protein
LAGTGSQVQKPPAPVVAGGRVLAPLPALVILPVLIDVLPKRAAMTGLGEAGLEAAE